MLVDASVDKLVQVMVLMIDPVAVDFKFINRGTVSSVLHHFEVEVVTFEPDPTPVLDFSYERHGPDRIGVTVDNFGWGPARDCQVSVTDPVLGRFLAPEALTTVAHLDSGDHRELLTISVDQIDRAEFDALGTRRAAMRDQVVAAMVARDPSILDRPDFSMLLSHHERWHVREYFEQLVPGPDSVRQKWHIEYLSQLTMGRLPVRLTLDVAYHDDDGNRSDRQVIALDPILDRPAEGELWIVGSRFSYDPHDVLFAPLTPTEAVVVILEPDSGALGSYAVSRTIPPGDADRFHVLLAAQQSGTYTVRVRFHTDAAEPVVSPPIRAYLRRDRNQRLPQAPADGALFAVAEDRLVPVDDYLVLRPPTRTFAVNDRG